MRHDIVAPTDCTVVEVRVGPGDPVTAGGTLAIVEMMKIERLVEAPVEGVVLEVVVGPGEVVKAGQPLVVMREQSIAAEVGAVGSDDDGTGERADLAEYQARRALLEDDARPEAIAKVHARGRRTARENLADLVDAGSFQEYGSFMYAAQKGRRDVDDLIRNTPGDGIVGGLGTVNAEHFGDEASLVGVMSYDYTVLAGTQGFRGHEKKDRLLPIVDQLQVPLVLFAEGGGGRPGDTDTPFLAGLQLHSFAWMGRLSGSVPSVAIVSGRCFAGNAALAGVCDVIIATPDANLGMAGPAMIEGGGLGQYRPEDIGPVDVQTANGVIDLLAADETHAVALTKQYLGFFQGVRSEWEAHDQAAMRDVVPENRKRIYEVRDAITTLADIDSTLELRPDFGRAIVTTLARIEGRPVGVIANDPGHLGGAIDSDSADKGARFMQLCDAHGLPIVSLCDTPGFMVGPEAEQTAQVRHFGRMFVVGASLTVPFVTVILRKAVGLGAMAMSAGSMHSSVLSVAWPTGEVSGMGIEGAVKHGARRELDGIDDPVAREARYDELVDRMYEASKALNAAAHGEIDDVIDPADTRRRVAQVLRRSDRTPGSGRPMVDTW
ncbi:MAG: carboxyl transferase domain-containing protein [Actinomycetota bacterium]